MESAEKQEKIWPNLVKYVCLIFIFLNHSEVYSNFHIPYYSTFVAPFFVNAFFFISGYFLIGSIISKLKQDDSLVNSRNICKKQLINLVFKLLIPALIFSAIEYVPACLIRKDNLSITQFLYKTIGGGTYWFVSALIIAELIIIVLVLFRRKTSFFYLIFTIMFCTTGILLSKFNIKILENYPDFPYYFKQGLISSIFLGLGGVFYQFEDKFDHFFKPLVLIGFALIYFITLIFGSKIIFTNVVGGNVNVIGILISLISIILLIYLFKPISSARNIIYFISFEGRHSIGLYFMAGAAPAAFSAILSRFLEKNTTPLLLSVFFLSFISANIMNYLLSKYFSFMFDLRKLRKTKKQNIEPVS